MLSSLLRSTRNDDSTDDAGAAARFRAIFEHAPIGMALISLEPPQQGRPLLVNPCFQEMFGYSEAELGERDPASLSHPDDLALGDEETVQLIRGEIASFTLEKRFLRADGTTLWGRLSVSRVDTPLQPRVAMVQIEDITARRRTREELDRLAVIVQTSPDAIFSTDADGRVLSWNPAAEAMYGYRAEELVGQSIARLLPPGAENDAPLLGDAARRVDARHVRRDGTVIDVAISSSPLRDADGAVVGVAAICRDVSEHKRLEDELRRHADFDALTGVHNRRSFEAALRAALAGATRYGRAGAVLIIDIDHFKFINDSFGHGTGDNVLRAVSAVLGQRVRETDAVGRLGGDEFAVLLDEVDAEGAAAIAADFLGRLRALGTHPQVTTSIGIATFDGSEERSAEDVLAAADVALYEAKEQGRNRAVVFRGRGRGAFAWYQEIAEAVAEERLALYAQPVIGLADGRPVGHELLLRMRSRDGAIVLPGAFLPTAERFDLIGALDRWVIDRAIELALTHPSLGVNLSARSLADAALLDWIVKDVRRRGVRAERLVFEITETAAIANLEDAHRFVERLRELGCGVALDDFGTGFGSFTYLKHLPVTHLKIDMEFVRALARSDADQRIVQAIVSIAAGSGIRTVAEGVEDEPSLRLLRDYGVTGAQGYFIGLPAPLG